MATILQSHHVIEQSAFDKHPLLQAIQENKLLDVDASSNRLYMPVDSRLANKLDMGWHLGKTDSSYTQGVTKELNGILEEIGGETALDKSNTTSRTAALERAATLVGELQDTLKIGIANGDVSPSVPKDKVDRQGRIAAKDANDRFFGHLDDYPERHPDQFKAMRSMGAVESEWSAITQSERRITTVVGDVQNGSLTLVRARGEPPVKDVVGRMEFRLAVSEAETAGRVTLSESNAALVRKVLVDDLPAIARAPSGLYDLASNPSNTYKPLSQRGFASMDMLLGEVPKNTLIRSGGLLTTGVDLTLSTQRVATHLEQNNPTAAQSEANHTLARNAGGWMGGGTAAYAVGTSGYLPAAIVMGDALLMSKAFDKAVDLKENRDIFHQTDKQGVEWTFAGRNWVKEGRIDSTPDGKDNPVESTLGAGYEKARELGSYATAKAVELALGKVPPPQDPFNLPASASEQQLDNPNWRRDPQTEQWQRVVKTGLTGANDRGIYEEQVATPERAAELNQQAIGRIQQNIASGREIVATTYLENYTAQRSQDFIKVPPAVQSALPKPDVVMGSDKAIYQRDMQGVWASDGKVAQGNLALELELTRVAREPSLQQFNERIAALQAAPAPTEAQKQQNSLLHQYRVTSEKTELTPEWQQAIELAVHRTREQHDIAGPGALELQPVKGKIGADSPIAHYRLDADGANRLVATTSTEDIRQALSDVQARNQQQAPIPASPELRIAAQSPQQREAHEQSLQEANRQGLSTQDAQQVAMLAAIEVRAPRLDEARKQQAIVEPQVERERTITTAAPASTHSPVTPPQSIAVAAIPVLAPAPEARVEPQVTRETSASFVQSPPPAAQTQSTSTNERSTLQGATASVVQPAALTPDLRAQTQNATQAAATAVSTSQIEGLRQGDHGPDVEFLQHRLHRIGMRGPGDQPVPQDGNFGPETGHAVRQFQQTQGLPATGVADAAMDSALAREQHARTTLSPTSEALLQERREQERQAQQLQEREARELQAQERREQLQQERQTQDLQKQEERERLAQERREAEMRQPQELPAKGDSPREASAPDATSAPAPSRDSLRLGDQGDDVAFLQYQLHRVGVAGPEGQPLPQDGRYGSETEHAVRQFQQTHDLPATGIGDQSLNEALARAHHARLEPTKPAEPIVPVEPASEQAIERASPDEQRAQAQAVSDVQRKSPSEAEAQQTAQAATSRVQQAPPQSEAEVLPQSAGVGISTSFTGPSLGGGTGSKRQEREEDLEAPAPDRQQARTFPTQHPDYALFAAIQSQLPAGTTDEKTAEIMHAAKVGRVDNVQMLRNVDVHNDNVFVYSHTAGQYSKAASISGPAPRLEETLEQTKTLDQRLAQGMEQFLAEQEKINREQKGPVMKMTLDGPGKIKGPGDDGNGGGDGGGGG